MGRVHWGVAPWAAQPLPLGARRALGISMQVRCPSSGRLVPIIPLWTLRKPAKELGFLSKRASQPRGPCAVASTELDPQLVKQRRDWAVGRTADHQGFPLPTSESNDLSACPGLQQSRPFQATENTSCEHRGGGLLFCKTNGCSLLPRRGNVTNSPGWPRPGFSQRRTSPKVGSRARAPNNC